jgi:hypothetical protein
LFCAQTCIHNISSNTTIKANLKTPFRNLGINSSSYVTRDSSLSPLNITNTEIPHLDPPEKGSNAWLLGQNLVQMVKCQTPREKEPGQKQAGIRSLPPNRTGQDAQRWEQEEGLILGLPTSREAGFSQLLRAHSLCDRSFISQETLYLLPAPVLMFGMHGQSIDP